jgi:hypothetical protein
LRRSNFFSIKSYFPYNRPSSSIGQQSSSRFSFQFLPILFDAALISRDKAATYGNVFAALAATISVTPSRSILISEIIGGKVHLDVMAGREGARGRTV